MGPLRSSKSTAVYRVVIPSPSLPPAVLWTDVCVCVKWNLVPILERNPWKHIVPGVGNVGAGERREKLAHMEVADQLEILLG